MNEGVGGSFSALTNICGAFCSGCAYRDYRHAPKLTAAWPSCSLILHWLSFRSLQPTVNLTSFFTPVYQPQKSITFLVKLRLCACVWYACVCACMRVGPCICYTWNSKILILLPKWGYFFKVVPFGLVPTTSNNCLRVKMWFEGWG